MPERAHERRRPLVVAQLAKNRRETLRVALDRYGGADLIDIRVCVELTEACHVQTPTKKGVSLNISQLPALRQALADAEAKARELGLIESEAAHAVRGCR